jgi:hypothetical protein
MTRFWRFEPSGQCLDDGGLVYVFMQQNFLYWLEALSLTGKLSEVVRAIQLLEDMVDVRLYKANSKILTNHTTRLAKVLGFKLSSMTLSGSSYIIDQLLRKHLFNYTVQPLSSPQRRVLFEQNLRSVS